MVNNNAPPIIPEYDFPEYTPEELPGFSEALSVLLNAIVACQETLSDRDIDKTLRACNKIFRAMTTFDSFGRIGRLSDRTKLSQVKALTGFMYNRMLENDVRIITTSMTLYSLDDRHEAGSSQPQGKREESYQVLRKSLIQNIERSKEILFDDAKELASETHKFALDPVWDSYCEST